MRQFYIRGFISIALSVFLFGCQRAPQENHPSYTPSCSGNHYLMKYHCSLNKIETAAESGDADAQYALGYMYYYGIDTVKDQETAELWMQRSAEQGQKLAKKALSIIQSGSKFQDVHKAASGEENSNAGTKKYTPGTSVIQYQKPDDVSELNAQKHSAPITQHLPAYPKTISVQVNDPRLSQHAIPVSAQNPSLWPSS